MNSILGRAKLVAAVIGSLTLVACDSIKNVTDEDFSQLPTPNVVLRGAVTGLTTSPVVLTAHYVAASGYVGTAPEASIVREVTADGPVSFAAIPQASQYTVSVTSLPIGKLCEVDNEAGTANANVTNVTVTCAPDPNAPTYKVSGTVVGLAGSTAGMQLKLSSLAGDETVSVPAAGTSFAFTSELLTDFDYEVTIESPPSVPGANGAPPTVHSCALNNASGTVVDTDIANVEVVCGFELAGGVYNLSFPAPSLAGLTLALERPGGVDTITSANLVAGAPGGPSTFTFPTLLPSHSAARYKLAITAQPAGVSCVVGNGGYAAILTPATPTPVNIACASVPAAPLTGTYKTGGTYVTFLQNGTFLAGNHGATAAASGTEHGLYAPGGFGPGTLVFYVLTDANGSAGIGVPGSGAAFNWPFGFNALSGFTGVAGSPAQISGTTGPPPGVPFSLTAVSSSGGPLGGWTASNGLSALVYETSGGLNTATYYSVDNLFANAFGQAPGPQFEAVCLTGVDTAATSGTYVQDRTAGCLPGGLPVVDLPDPASPSDFWAATYGQPGPPAFGPAPTVTYTVTGNTLSLAVPGPPPTVFNRSLP